MSSFSVHSAAAAAHPSSEAAKAPPPLPAAALVHAPAATAPQQPPLPHAAASLAAPKLGRGEAATKAAAPWCFPAASEAAATKCVALFSPGDTVWIPSAAAGFTTAVVVAVDCACQRILVRRHRAATEELRAADGGLSGEGTEPLAVFPPENQEEEHETPGQQQHHQQRDAQQQPQENQQPASLVPRKLDGGLKVAATAGAANAVEAAEGRAAAGDQVLAPSDCEGSKIYVRFTEAWTYRPLPAPPAAVPEDAAALDSLSAASVLQLLQHRFARKQIYTFAAHVLLAVNPCRTLPGLYGYDVVEVYRSWRGRQSRDSAAALLDPRVAQYLGLSSTSSSTETAASTRRRPSADSEEDRVTDGNSIDDSSSCTTLYDVSGRNGNKRRGRTHRDSGGSHAGSTGTRSNDSSSSAACRSSFPPAHPFAVAQDAHRRLRGEGQKQTIIVSGESGAGKTETSKILMLYLTEVGSLLSSSSCNRSARSDRRKACQSSPSSGSSGGRHSAEEEEQQQHQLPLPLQAEEREDEGQSRQAQRRAAAAALLHAAAAKHATRSTFSPAACSPSLPGSPSASYAFVGAASGSPRGASSSSSSPDTPRQCGAGSPSASGSMWDVEAQQSAAAGQSQEPAAGELQQRILSCNPVLEAFCNAKTRRNSNSSRVGRLTLLHYDRAGLLHGASIRTYLLESTRVCSHPLWERNFHVFYQLLRGCSNEDLESRRLQRCCSAYRLLTPTPVATRQRNEYRLPARRLVVSAAPAAATLSTPRGSAVAAPEPPPPSQEEIDRDADSYGLLVGALSKTGFSAAEVEELFDALAGLLHLSNVSFKEIPALETGATHALVIRQRSAAAAPARGGTRCSSSGEGAGATAVSDSTSAIESAAELLRLPLEQLEEVLLWETLTMRHETLRKQRRAEQAAAARDALIKCTYTRIVRFILAKLNESVVTRQGPTHRLLDYRQQLDQPPSITLRHPNGSNSSSESSSTANGGPAGAVRRTPQADLAENATALESNRNSRRRPSSCSPEEGVAAALWGTGLSIGILDIYGFECLDGGANGFEQLCINYANEKQQQIFLQRAISEELRLYRCEGLFGVLSSLQPALLSNDSSSDSFAAAPAAPLSPHLSSLTSVPRSSTAHDGSSRSDSRWCNNSASSSSSAGSDSRGPTWLLQRQRLYCEQQTEELLSYLTDGLFKRLDDNSRLRARGQQQRLDVHFWRDFFAFCRQREQHRQLAAASNSRTSTGSSSSSRRVAALQHQEQQQPPILFRLLRSGGGNHSTAAYGVRNEDTRSPAGVQQSPDAPPLQQEHHEKMMQQLLAAGEVRPLHADAAAAASTLQQGVFVVKHFAGLVEYRVDGWLARNNDKAEAEIECLLGLSRLRALQEADASATDAAAVDGDSSLRGLAAGWLVSAQGRSSSPAVATAAGGSAASNSSSRHFASVSQQFVADLRQLMGELQSSDVHLHFIRCFVSNRSMRPLLLDRALLLRQLQQSGTVALIHVLHRGFPHRVPLSPLAAVFRSKLRRCIADATAQLQQQHDNCKDRDAAPGEWLRRLQALHVDHVPDGRLVAVALGLLPDCPRGAVSCGISLLFFKASAFLAATAFLRSPEALFSRTDMLLLLQRELTRRRWGVAAAVAVHVRRRLAWLLRRVRLLRVIKQRFIICAVRVLLLRRCILRPLLLRVQKRAAAAAALKLLLRLLIARGFHAWLLAYRRATAAEGAAQSLAARVAAATGGKGEQVAVGQWPQLQQQLQTQSNSPALLRRRSSKDGEAAHRAAAAATTIKEGSQQQAEPEKLPPQRQPYPLQETTCNSSTKAGEIGDAASLRANKPRSSSSLQDVRKGADSCWWRAALFSVSSNTTCSRCSAQHSSAQTTAATSAGAAAAALTPLRRETYETFLLFTGKQLYAVQLRITQQLQQQSDLAALGLGSAGAAAKPQQHVVIRCFALAFASEPETATCRTQGSLCSRRTAWQTLDQLAGRHWQQPTSDQEQQQQEQTTTHHPQLQRQPDQEWRQQQLPQEAQSARQAGQWSNAETAAVQPATAAADHSGKGVQFTRTPTLACVAQHPRHPKLFVGCDRQARIFLLPLHFPPFSSSPSVEDISSNLLSSASCFGTAVCTTAECDAAPEASAAAAASSAAEKQNFVQQQLRQAETRQQQQRGEQQSHRVPPSFLQQQSLQNDYRLANGCSKEEHNRCSTSRRTTHVEAITREQRMTAQEKEEEHFLALCNAHSEKHLQIREQRLLPLCAEKVATPRDLIARTENVLFLGDVAAGEIAAACEFRENGTAVSAGRAVAAGEAAQQPSVPEFCTPTLPHAASCCPSVSCAAAASVAAVGHVSRTRKLPPKSPRRFHEFSAAPAESGAATDSKSRSDYSGRDNCSRGRVPHDSNGSSVRPNSGTVCKDGTNNNSAGQTSCSSSISGYSISQRLVGKEARDAGSNLSRSASSVYVDSEAANSSVCSLSSATKKTLKSLGGGQPSTWLPALVPAAPDPSVCRRPAAAAAAGAAFSSPAAAGGNPYLAPFRRAAPLPASAVPDALSAVAAVHAEQRHWQQRQQEQQKELWLHVAPWVEVQTRVRCNSTLLLPRSCCFPHTVGPAAWVPATLLERAEQRHEQAVLQHHHRQHQQMQQKERQSQQSSLLPHQRSEEQQQQERELRQQQQQLHQRHVTVRPVRIHFASSYSTQHVLILAYVSAASSSSNSRAGRHDANNRRNNIRGGRQQQQHHGIAVVAGLWAVVLVDLLRQRALDWKEIFAAESDVIQSARIHRRQFPLLFPHAVLASHCWSYPSTVSNNSSSSDIGGDPHSCRSGSSSNGGDSSSNGGDSSSSSAGLGNIRVNNNDRSNNRGSAASTCAVSPSQIVSTGLLESCGEGMWIVAGPGLLGLLQVRLRQGSGSSSTSNKGETYSSKQNSSEIRGRNAANESKDTPSSHKHSSHVAEPEGRVEVLWNQARVQQFLRRRAGEPPAGAAAAGRSCFDVASTWFTGCTYTATPLIALQDIGRTHPLVTWGALAPDREAALLLQQHFQHLVLLTCATGDLLLLRWLPQKRRLRMLCRLLPLQHHQQTEFTLAWRRFIRVQYADAPEEEEGAAAEQLLLGRGDGCCCCLSSSKFRPVGTAVLHLSQVHPHARKQQQQRRRSSSEKEGLSLPARRATGRRQRNAAREEKKVAKRRWLDDIGTLAGFTKENLQRSDAAASAAEASTPAVAGRLRRSAAKGGGGTASAGTGTGAASTTKTVQILRLEMPPLMKKKQSAARGETVFAGRRTDVDGCSTSAESTTSEEAFPGGSSGKGSEGSSPESHHYRNSRSNLGHSICSSGNDRDSQANSNRELKQGEEKNRGVHASICLFGSRSELPRSNSQLQQAEPLPQRPDPRQQQQPGRREHREPRQQIDQQKQQSLQHRADSAAGAVHTEKQLEVQRSSAATSTLLSEGQISPAPVLFANCTNNGMSAAATLTEGHVVAVAPLQSLKDALVLLRTTETGEPQLAVIDVANMQQPSWSRLSLH